MKLLILRALSYFLISIAIVGCGENSPNQNYYDISKSPYVNEMEKSFDIVESATKQLHILDTDYQYARISADEYTVLRGDQVAIIKDEVDKQDITISAIKGLSPPYEAKKYHDLLVMYYAVHMSSYSYLLKSIVNPDENVRKNAHEYSTKLMLELDSRENEVDKEYERYLKSKK